jgi:homoserine acetyltransferase
MSTQSNHDYQEYDLHQFTFQNGTTLPLVRLAYQEYNPHAQKIALIPTCFRGRIQSTLTFGNGAFQDYRIIVVALFGNGESSSPSNTPGFPETIDYRDCVRAQYSLITKHLNIASVDVMLGFSMGGQCTYYWTAMYPKFVRNAIIVCSSARTSLHNYQFLEGPKTALKNSSDYSANNCHAKTARAPQGLNAFGKAYSAWLTSAEWFEQERFKDLGYKSLQDWDKAVTSTNYKSWDPDDLLAKVQMWQNSDLSVCYPDCNGSLEDALARIQARVLLLPCQTDQYFRWEASEREHRWLQNATLEIIPSVWGHLAGAGSNQQDVGWMDKTIAAFLDAA